MKPKGDREQKQAWKASDHSGGLTPAKAEGKGRAASDWAAPLWVPASPKGALKKRLTVAESHIGQKWPGPWTRAMLRQQVGAHALGFNTERDPKGTTAGGCQLTAPHSGFSLAGLPLIATRRVIGWAPNTLQCPGVNTFCYFSKHRGPPPNH